MVGTWSAQKLFVSLQERVEEPSADRKPEDPFSALPVSIIN